jgi:rhodanese-related sulfurtransferase
MESRPETEAPKPSDVPTVTREELRDLLARRDGFDLLMAGSNFSFAAKHIPGSRHFSTPAQLFASVPQDRPLVVYCSNIDCNASHSLIKKLVEHGYTNVRHYPGGLLDWEAAGWPLEGEWAE